MRLSIPRRRRGIDNRQLYSIPYITSLILVYQRDNHKKQYPNLVVYCSPAEGGGTIRKNSHFVSSAIHIKIDHQQYTSKLGENNLWLFIDSDIHKKLN